MRENMIGKLLLACILVMAPLSVYAGRDANLDWEDVTDLDWAISEDTANDIVDAVIIFDKITEDDEEIQDGKVYRTEYRRIRILSDKGRDWADVEVPVYSLNQKIKKVMGRTIQRDGTVLELQSDQIFEKEVVKTEGNRVKQTMFSLPGVTSDCIVEYIVQLELKGYVAGWIAQEDIAVKHGEYRWILAKIEFTQHLIEYLKELGPSRDFTVPNFLWLNTTTRPRCTYLPSPDKPEELLFEIDNIPPYKGEPFTVPSTALKSRIISYLGCDKSPTIYWGDLALNYDRHLTEFCEKDKKVKEVASQFADLPTDKEKIDAVYKWIQDNITNLNYYDLFEINDKGEKKYHDPKEIRCADDVIKFGYAYRGTVNRIFIDMLRALNINARICYAKDRFDDLFIQQAMYDQFDNSLVAVVVGPGQYDFYAPGHALTPPNLVPWFLEGVQTLVVGADDFFVVTPFSPSIANTTNATFSYEIDDNLNLRGKLNCQMTGHDARGVRIAVVNEEDSDLDDIIKDELTDIIPDAELDSISWENVSDANASLGLACSLRYPPLSETANRLLVKPCDYLTSFENPFYADKRLNNVLFRYSHELNETAQFEIPDGWSVEAMPSDSLFKCPIGSCSIKFASEGNSISVQRTFVLAAPFWNVTSYSAIRNLYQTAADFDNLIVVLSKKQELGSTD